jgi:hypothetical protein
MRDWKPRISTLLFLLVVFAFTTAMARSHKLDGVRGELAGLQEQTGLGLGYFGFVFGKVDFAHRPHFRSQPGPGPASHAQDGGVSPHATMIAFAWPYSIDGEGRRIFGSHPEGYRLGIVHIDGTGLVEFPAIKEPQYFCWSADESKLAVSTDVRGISGNKGRLVVLDLHSNQVEEIATGPAFLTPQCWSPDGRSLVYKIYALGDEHKQVGSVAIYNLSDRTTKVLGPGAHPTWSVDAAWIAFLEGDDYYVVRPDGTDKRVFLHAARPMTGLLWSPDGRYVAYGVCCKYSITSALWRFYVRRLSDNAEDWVADINNIPHGDSVHWIQTGGLETRKNGDIHDK